MPSDTFFNLNHSKQDKIDDILLNIFANHNIANVSVSQIVTEMKMSRGAFYKYFTDLLDAYQYISQKAMLAIHDSILAQIMDNDNNLFVGLKAFIINFSSLNHEDVLYKYFSLLRNVQSDGSINMPKNINMRQWMIILEKSNVKFESHEEQMSYLVFIMSNLINLLKNAINKNWDEEKLLQQYEYFRSWLK